MSYNILYFLMENSISLLVGFLSANLVGSIGYVIWLFLQKGTAKFYIQKGLSFLKILLMSYFLPLLLAVPLWSFFQIWRTDWVGIGLTIPMKIGIFLLFLIWLVSMAVILIYRYASYLKVRSLSFMNVPLEDEEILNILNKWKTKLHLKKKVMIFYNETITSPALVYYNGYKILLPVYEMSTFEMNIVLLHELMHLKNRDIFTKNIGFAVNVLYSFNPVTYAIRKEISKWEEVNCDFCCCAAGKDEFTSKEYFHCIVDLKERCGNVNSSNIMCCMFEAKDLIKFRIDIAKQMQEEKIKRSNRSFMITAMLIFILTLFSFSAIVYGMTYCYEKTVIYVEEEQSEKTDGNFKEDVMEEWFADSKVSYFGGDILNDFESTKFPLDPEEVKVFTLSDGYSGALSVMIISNGSPYQFGFIKSEEWVRYTQGLDDCCIRIDTDWIEGKHLFIKNNGKQVSQMELLVIENIE